MNVEQTLADLVAIDSRSSRTNVEVINYVVPLVERTGMCAHVPFG